MNETEITSIWNKTAAELTVADQLKISAVSVAVVVAVPVAFFGTIAVVNSVRNKFQRRKLVPVTNIITEEVEED